MCSDRAGTRAGASALNDITKTVAGLRLGCGTSDWDDSKGSFKKDLKI
jgi:hypothetical protein